MSDSSENLLPESNSIVCFAVWGFFDAIFFFVVVRIECVCGIETVVQTESWFVRMAQMGVCDRDDGGVLLGG